jgi:hypothetical protein
MDYFASEALIGARASIVWEVITDAGNLTVWESGITAIDGELRHGGTIRINTPTPAAEAFGSGSSKGPEKS